jgi:tRNA-Thr(GGU) m(6)t(6)A37 methyltransferase TsaA
MEIKFEPIGTIRTPYRKGGFVPSQPLMREDASSRLELREEFTPALEDLAWFAYIYVLYYLHEGEDGWEAVVSPPWAGGRKVGLFASRSPRRPNRIGLSIVRLRRVEGSTLITSVLDVYDGTPLLDLKPYIKALDAKTEANNGWISELDNHEHILDHLQAIPHEHHRHKPEPCRHHPPRHDHHHEE